MLWCITIVGIPVGLQCFKYALLCFFPFGKEIRYSGRAGSLLLNIIWILVFGLPLAIESTVMGCLLRVTVIGIPFGLQHFKIARLALMPFESGVVRAVRCPQTGAACSCSEASSQYTWSAFKFLFNLYKINPKYSFFKSFLFV